MTRIVSFVDGYTSSTAPAIRGSEQEDYNLPNNLAVFTDIAGLVFDKDDIRSAFIVAEIRRYHEVDGDPIEYVQTKEFTLVYNGGWELIMGIGSGIDMLQESDVVNNYDVALLIDFVSGQMRAKTGNMAGAAYVGTLKISVTRIV